MSEVHAKLYMYNYKGVVKEIRRVGLHMLPEYTTWAAASRAVQAIFGVTDAGVTYVDPEGDRVALDCQEEWEECLRLAAYGVHSPLRLHIKKRAAKEGKAAPKPAEEVPPLQPLYAYTTDGAAVPPDVQRLQESIPALLRPFVSADKPVPEWLHGCMTVVPDPHTAGAENLDIDVGRLALCLSTQALRLMTTEMPDYAAALELFRAAHDIQPRNEKFLYNIACCHALLGNPTEAFSNLESAVNYGFQDQEHLLSDEDLQSLREDARFAALLTKITAKAQPAAEREPEPEAVPCEATPQPEEMAPEPEEVREVTVASQTNSEDSMQEDAYEVVETPAEAEVPYPEQLAKLQAMGFFDVAANKRALEAANGSMTIAIEMLLG